jgi:hypothetical protein
MDGLFEARARLQATLKASETAFEARRKTSAETKLVPLEATAPRTEEPCASPLSHSPPDVFSPLEGSMLMDQQIETNIQKELKGLGMNLSRLREQVDVYKEGRHLQSDQELHTEKIKSENRQASSVYHSGYVKLLQKSSHQQVAFVWS